MITICSSMYMYIKITNPSTDAKRMFEKK